MLVVAPVGKSSSRGHDPSPDSRCWQTRKLCRAEVAHPMARAVCPARGGVRIFGAPVTTINAPATHAYQPFSRYGPVNALQASRNRKPRTTGSSKAFMTGTATESLTRSAPEITNTPLTSSTSVRVWALSMPATIRLGRSPKRLCSQRSIKSTDSGQSTCYQTGQFYLLPTFKYISRPERAGSEIRWGRLVMLESVQALKRKPRCTSPQVAGRANDRSNQIDRIHHHDAPRPAPIRPADKQDVGDGPAKPRQQGVRQPQSKARGARNT